METNEILARWQGWYSKADDVGKLWHDNKGNIYAFTKDYLNDIAAAMSLLDTLVKRGYKVQLVSSLLAEYVTWDCFITYAPKQTTHGNMDVQTINEAIVTAVLELIEKTNSSEV